ncbi:MAG: radical SAM protein [Clostridia bacterium]|nr:radical SAM protein [Clostridia bacterium]
MKKQYIIPIFVPHLGCPNDCIFCNQRKISGQMKNVTENDVRDTIEFYLSNFKEKDAHIEVAFYGGSFTGIDVELQDKLLQAAYDYIKEKKVHSIRISTRPDYIDKATLKRLKKYKVKTIELGVQSTNDFVLDRCKRGHTFEDVVKASKLIKRFRMKLGHQMMIGLPESTELDDLQTAKDLIKLKPDMVRIYPVLVIKGTQLEKEYNENQYDPLTVEQAVERCKELCYMFGKKKIDVIRIGLQNTDTICSPTNQGSEVVAGPYHETFRQLVESSIYYDTIVSKIKKINTRVKEVTVIVNPQNVNNVVGYKKSNIQRLKEMYDVDVVVKQDIKYPAQKIDVKVTKRFRDFIDEDETAKK